MIYTETDVYEMSKSELLGQCTVPVQNVSTIVKSEKSKDFDLFGRQIRHSSSDTRYLPHGIYIHNGKKVVVKQSEE